MSTARTIAIPRLLHVAHGCLPEVGALLDGHDFDLRKVLVGSGPGPSRMFAERVVTSLRAQGAEVLHRPHLSGRLDQAAALAGTIIEEGVTVAVGVGGGRVLDTVKLAASRTDVDLVAVPTTISNDGISSPVASLTGRDGARASHGARMPCGIVMDVAPIASAPAPTLRAGVGDLVSNLTACLDWRLADARGHARYDAFAAMIAEAAARPALELRDLTDRREQEVLAHGLLLSGLAMAAAGTSRPCSGAEHLISHALDARAGGTSALHGAQVAVGSLVSAAAHGDDALLDALSTTYRRLGLPTTAEDLGLTREDLAEAVRTAPSLRPDRWTVLSDDLDVDELLTRALGPTTVRAVA